MEYDIPVEALNLIKEHEGLHKLLPDGRLESYLCPSSVWTIGRGSTFLNGLRIKPNQICTLEEAEKQFEIDVANSASFVSFYVKSRLTSGQFGALVSFVHNVGSGKFSRSTLLRRINSGEDVAAVCIAELPRWIHDDKRNVLPGLVSRRHSELTLIASDGIATTKEAVMSFRLANAAKFDKGLTWQRTAWEWLFANAPEKAWDEMQKSLPSEVFSGFAARFSPPASTPAPLPLSANPLVGIPRFTQRDSQWIQERDRKCYSSTNAKLVEFLKPGTLTGINGDDAYLAKLKSIGGDTIHWAAQQRTLASYGIKAKLVKNASWATVEREIKRGHPVPLGYLHRGPVWAPRGGGHWCLCHGISATHIWISDPWGEPDLVSGATLSSGNWQGRVTRLNFGKRWMVEEAGNGVYRFAEGKGWAVIVDSIS